jgi:hypothetical protein
MEREASAAESNTFTADVSLENVTLAGSVSSNRPTTGTPHSEWTRRSA